MSRSPGRNAAAAGPDVPRRRTRGRAAAARAAGALVLLALLALPCAGAPAPPAAPPQAAPPDAAPPPAAVPAPPPAAGGGFPDLPLTPYYRVVPMNEARTIGFFTALFPDCSPQGPTVARLLTKPRHGSVTFTTDASFPRYGAASPLVACNARKVQGVRMTFEAEEGYEGLDAFRVLVIYPDGSASSLDVRVSIR
ncbi:hypothetical protein OPKNFCMD_1212 [Methylobacterium crusticola]|uniref:Lipoprotein n=2 Tax=Methylobacterium crusticola TaxID=1697972 RepID=A0ABQ4QTV9_9HYPH|nr:hypothetical protein [Methylobacterium crusticola]GJD48491.1 hypothetical protein OPKNFCMD_1212 [Methylobacterium crusticola]